MKSKVIPGIFIVLITLVGIELGGGIYEGIVVASVWSSNPPQSFALLQGPLALPLGNFWAPHHLLTQIVIILALIVCWKEKKQRNLVLLMIGLYLLLRIPTFLYFIPELNVFSTTPPEGPDSPELAERASLWVWLSAGRMGIIAAVYILSWMALGHSYEKKKAPVSSPA
jgi:hypothetical protein